MGALQGPLLNVQWLRFCHSKDCTLLRQNTAKFCGIFRDRAFHDQSLFGLQPSLQLPQPQEHPPPLRARMTFRTMKAAAMITMPITVISSISMTVTSL